MPLPGTPGQGRSQAVKLMFNLRKDASLRDSLRFVAFDQGNHFGLHFVVEDGHSVYDQSCKFEGLPNVTRVTKETYEVFYTMASDNSKPICRLDNDQFQILYDIMVPLQRERGPETLMETYTRMRLIAAMWNTGPGNESEEKRACRIINRFLPTGSRLYEAQ